LYTIETCWYAFLSVIHRNNSGWHYYDSENATEVSTRARKALAYIESLRTQHESVVIVSHAMFINIMVAFMCRDRMLNMRDLSGTFLHIGRMRNASVIHVEYVGNGSAQTCNWRLVEDTV
jgi:broad specificity phosphatase PhoE